MILSTTSWYSRCLAAVGEVGEPFQRLVGGFEVVGLVDLVELLERVSGDSQSGMGRKDPIQVDLVGFGEMIGPAQQGEPGFGTVRARMWEVSGRVRGVGALCVPG